MAGASESRPGTIKTNEQIECIARAGAVVAEALHAAVDAAIPGVTTGEIDGIVRGVLNEADAKALFLGYIQGGAPPFPGAACISVNDEVVHGVPGKRVLTAGDVVSIDVGVRLDGWCADAATSVLVPGDADADLEARVVLIGTLRSALDACLDSIMPGKRWSEIAWLVEQTAGEAGLGMVAEYIGHGIGRELHEWPRVPAYRTGYSGDDFVLEPGMVLAIEPIFTARSDGSSWGGRPSHAVGVCSLDDGWTVVTKGGMVAAHEERTVAVTPSGCKILTPLELARA